MLDPRMLAIAIEVTDEVFGKGTYHDMNKNSPDPEIRAAALAAPKPDEKEGDDKC